MDTAKCPVCGEVNPADAEFCRNCLSRLEPLAGPAKGEDAPLQPGQVPTKKTTADLEPILPQWLREARETARQSASEEATDSSSNINNPRPVTSSKPDLLAGLASQGKDEDDEDNEAEEVPDWLVSLTGDVPVQKKKADEPDAGDGQRARWVELGRQEEKPSSNLANAQASSGTSVENATPSWMTPQEPAPEKDELTDWLSRADQVSASSSTPLPASDQPAGSAASALPPSTPSPSGETPDWLNNLQSFRSSFETSSPSLEEQPALSQPDELPASASPQSAMAGLPGIPDWLKAFDQGSLAPAINSSDLPDWLKNVAPQGEVSSKGESPQTDPPPAPLPSETSRPKPSVESNKTPDWLSAYEPANLQPPGSMPAFVDGALENVNVEDLNASLQAPDWLSGSPSETTDQAASEANPHAAAQTGEAIVPAALPSWVQAMRPVESALPSSIPQSGRDSFLEAGGPLAGLQGVLPVGMFRPTSKPKTYSMKLNATTDHQTQAALLEQVLAAEITPIPMMTSSVIFSQRVLRWVIAVLMFVVVGGILFSGTEIFGLPARIPNDQTEMAISDIEKIPVGAPVLVVFDYEPSLSGEMQTVAEPYLNRLLLLKHPRVAILSSSPTGSALAESFIAGPLAERSYNSGKQYIDLGYLPGGLAGIYDFARNPTAVMPLDVDGSPPWRAAPLQGITHFSDFASVILLTDSAETGRVWIEQAGPMRGNSSLVVISSSQAGPMLMPYFASGQINGLVNGLNDASKVEQANGQAGLAARYWDAYSVGLLLAAGLILLGGLWNIVSGIKTLAKQKDGS
jgi:hypothetical protein